MIVNSPCWDLQEKVAVSYELKNVINTYIFSKQSQTMIGNIINADVCSSLFISLHTIYI